MEQTVVRRSATELSEVNGQIFCLRFAVFGKLKNGLFYILFKGLLSFGKPFAVY